MIIVIITIAISINNILVIYILYILLAVWALHNAILQCVAVHRVPKFTSCHNAIMVVTGRADCSILLYTYIYICLIAKKSWCFPSGSSIYSQFYWIIDPFGSRTTTDFVSIFFFWISASFFSFSSKILFWKTLISSFNEKAKKRKLPSLCEGNKMSCLVTGTKLEALLQICTQNRFNYPRVHTNYTIPFFRITSIPLGSWSILSQTQPKFSCCF